MIKEIKINQTFDIRGDKYYILSVYFTDTRILMDILSEYNPPKKAKVESFFIPKTYEEHLMEMLAAEQNRKHHFDMLVNGDLCRMNSRRSNIYGDQIPVFRPFTNIRIPDELKNKQIELSMFEFEPVDAETQIQSISLGQRETYTKYVVRQNTTVPMKLEQDFEFRFTDPVTGDDKCIYIRNFTLEPIQEDRRNLFGTEEGEGILYADVEFDSSVKNIDLFTEKRLKGGINYTHAPFFGISKLENVRPGYTGLHMPLGYAFPEQTEVTLVLFSIIKKSEDGTDTIIYRE